MAGEGTARRAVNRVRHMVAAVGVHRMEEAAAVAGHTVAAVVAARAAAVVAVEAAAAAAVGRAAVAADIPVARTKTPFVAVRTQPCRD